MTARRAAKFGGLTLAIVLAVAVFALGSLWLVQRGQTLPNTLVASVDVGGLREDEVRAALATLVDQRESAEVVVVFEGDEYRVRPSELGYAVDLDATVAMALERGRSGLPGDIAERISSLRTTADLPLVHDFDHDAAEDWVTTLAQELDSDERFGAVTVDPATLDVEVELPSRYLRVDQQQVLADLRSALLGDGPKRFELTAETEPQTIPDEAVLAVADQVERAVAAPLELRYDDASLTLQPRDIARIIDVREAVGEQGPTLELAVDPASVDAVMGAVASGRFESEPVDARYSIDRTPPTSFDVPGSGTFTPVEAPVDIVDGVVGTRFDPAIAADQLAILLRDGARAAHLRLDTIEPDFSTEQAQQLRPTHLLGTFTTYFTAGQSRSHNIQLLADTIDGVVVLPGEQFSINEISGPRTCDKGYLEAGTIIRGELVPTCGGGTSQFGTTTFNAAFFSGVQLDQWKAHSWYISRYPMGREATLTYPELDVKFTNTTDGAILVKTSHTASSVTVSLYGQPIASAVSASHGSPTNPTNYSTQRRQVASLAPGQERIVQAGTGGFTVEVVRTIERLDGTTDTQTIRTVYVPQTRIVEHGPPAPAAGGPDDDDVADDAEADDAEDD